MIAWPSAAEVAVAHDPDPRGRHLVLLERAEVTLDTVIPERPLSPKTFAMRLRTFRLKRVLTQDTLAKNIGVSRGYLARLEMGRHDPPLSRLRKLAKALGVPMVELLG